MITQEKYNQMRAALETKQITETEWKEFCIEYFKQILSYPQNIAVLKRLKDR